MTGNPLLRGDGIAEIRAVAGRISDVDDHVTVHQAADEIERLRAELVEERHTVLEIVRSQDEFGEPHGWPWRVAPWGDGSSDTGNSNIISDRWQVVIAAEMPTETAEFIVASVRFTTEAADEIERLRAALSDTRRAALEEAAQIVQRMDVAGLSIADMIRQRSRAIAAIRALQEPK